MDFKILFFSLFTSFTLVGCGGGGGGSGSSTPIVGTFVDSPVQGLKYECSSGTTGTTNVNGEYTCFSDESVTFSIGNIEIGTVAVQSGPITPYTMFPTNTTAALNLARLLQSVDIDNNPANGITLNSTHINLLPTNLSFTSGTFVNEVETPLGINMVSEYDAMSHLDDTISKLAFNQNQKDFLYNLFHTEYYWASSVPNINYSNFSNSKDMINALSHASDRWSYSQTVTDNENKSNQSTKGFGYYAYSNGLIYKVNFNSPAETGGLQRGDQIVKINGEAFSAGVVSSSNSNIGQMSTFEIIRKGQTLNIQITPQEYIYKVLKANIFVSQSEHKVGHMIFESFTDAAYDEIEEAFTYFKNNAINDLVIDIRYNGGGNIVLASILLDKIAGKGREDLVQFNLYWNADNEVNNGYYSFVEDANSLDLNRVFFLTTYNTASASEIVINALDPYIDVKTMGSGTHGKPYGMRGKINGEIIYWLINFTVYNSSFASFQGGIGPDCYVPDNTNYLRDDVEGDMLHEALYYIENSSCSNGVNLPANTYQ